MNKKYTTITFFKEIIVILKKNGLYPDIIEYAIPANEKIDILTEDFDIYGQLNFGVNEGIYIDLYARGYLDNTSKQKTQRLGTIKTLGSSKEYLYKMSKLQADFMFEAKKFVNKYMDECFTWTGFSILKEKDGKLKPILQCYTKERAEEKAKEFSEKYKEIYYIRDNSSKKVEEIANE